ncbi:MAG: HlyD family efflux transporter periplasmic adaptor subunit [Planctomycetaceae bacterium]
MRSADSAEVRREVLNASSQRWLVREEVDDRAWLAIAADVQDSSCISEFEEILRSIVILHADAERRNRIRVLNKQVDRQTVLLNLIAQLHTSERLDQACNIMATDAAALMEVDRISVLRVDGGETVLLATTGVVDPERRANSSRCLRMLADTVLDADRDIAWTEVSELGETGVEQAAKQCCMDSGSSLIQTARTKNDPSPAVLILEQFKTHVPDTSLLPGIMQQFESSLDNIDQRTGGLGGRLSLVRRYLTGSAGRILGVVLALVLMLWLIPADFTVEAPGTLYPTVRQDVFAPEAGLIVGVEANDSDVVQANAVLLRMSNPEIDLKRERIKGDLDTATSRLAAVTASRSRIDPQTGLSQAAIEEELGTRIKSLQRQLGLVDKQLDSLIVRAPIPGLVSHGDLSRSLAGRPVQKGQFLVQMADPKSEWEIILQIPDKMVRHVLSSRSETPQSVSFILRMATGQRYTGTLDWVGSSTDLDVAGQLSTPARVRLTESDLLTDGLELRPGATVIAKIDCGRRSLGYVLFADIVDLIQRQLLF